MNNLTQIYIYLIGEGTYVWRPVQAVNIRGDIYRIVSLNFDTEDEQWQFASGDLVRCKERISPGNETYLIAYEQVTPKSAS